ncbi:MAG: hypothetical protein H0U28_14205 [Nocardioidaceae bacterium]|nr:hypothetical protein [Nocardioidaceae bacterium]
MRHAKYPDRDAFGTRQATATSIRRRQGRGPAGNPIWICGGAGRDTITGNEGDDHVYGQDGGDTCNRGCWQRP